tara:strand:+ start:17511 stop:17882 length:372 start_codon:yes stop_codon:yes gene_type:complete
MIRKLLYKILRKKQKRVLDVETPLIISIENVDDLLQEELYNLPIAIELKHDVYNKKWTKSIDNFLIYTVYNYNQQFYTIHWGHIASLLNSEYSYHSLIYFAQECRERYIYITELYQNMPIYFY